VGEGGGCTGRGKEHRKGEGHKKEGEIQKYLIFKVYGPPPGGIQKA